MSSPEKPEFTGDIEATAQRMHEIAVEYGQLANRFTTFAAYGDTEPDRLQPLIDQASEDAEHIELHTRRIYSTVTHVSDRLQASEDAVSDWPPVLDDSIELVEHGPPTNLVSRAEAIRQVISEKGPISSPELRKEFYDKPISSGSYKTFKKWIKSTVDAGYVLRLEDGTYVPRNYSRPESSANTTSIFSDTSLQNLLGIIRNAQPTQRKSRNRF